MRQVAPQGAADSRNIFTRLPACPTRRFVRLHFQERPWDLFFIVGFAVLVSVILFVLGVGNPLGLSLMLFAPGYLLVAVLFPSKKPIDWMLRIVLSIGLSVAIGALLGVFLNYTPLGITIRSVVASIGVLCAVLGLVGYRRRIRLPPGERLGATWELSSARWRDSSLFEKVVAIVLLTGIIATAALVVVGSIAPRQDPPFTDLSLLGPGGIPADYPDHLNASEPGTVVARVGNHEYSSVQYSLRVDLAAMTLRFNPVTGRNETVEVNRTSLSWFNFTIGHGQTWTRPYTFAISGAGLWKLDFLLFRDGDLATVYRKVSLLVTVT